MKRPRRPAPGDPWIDAGSRARAEAFARSLGLTAEHDALVREALTHPSSVEELPLPDNDRLEFLGDRVLDLIVTEHLFRTHPESPEGLLTRLKIRYVSEPSLALVASAIGLGSLVVLAPGDEAAGGRERPSTLSDALEAVIAALYLARGLEAAREFVQRELLERVDPTEAWDHKSRFQELCQERLATTPVYQTELESGPAHNPRFVSRALVDGAIYGEGTGASKRAAEQAAAAISLERLERTTAPSKVS
jgi:ribonuclease-3